MGWDAISGIEATQPQIENIEVVTDTPRHYGFHATLKPPFRLVDYHDLASLSEAVSSLASDLRPVSCETLKVSVIGKFLALAPVGDTNAIDQLAVRCVKSLDSCRAPLNDAELARRRASGLSRRQEHLLQKWGYPYVDEEFNYHITLTGKLDEDELEKWRSLANDYFDLPVPYVIDSLALVGERDDGCFELIGRYTLKAN